MSGIKVVDEISSNTRNSSGSRSGASTRYNSAIVDSISITNRSTKSVKKHYIEIIVPKLLRDSENDNSIYPPKRIQSSPSHRAETIHNRQRRFSQDSTLTGFDVSKQRRFSVQPSSFSLDNLRRAEFSDNCNNLPMKSIFTHDDDIIESPLLKTTEDNWTTTDVPQTVNQQPSHLINETDNDAFGPKVSNEHIPGTPMERQDTITQANSIINDINNYQRLNERSGPSTPRKNSDGSIYTTNSDQSSTASHLQFKKTDKRNSIPALNGENLIGRRVSKQDKEGLDPESLMFRDNRRKIDMVLAFEEESEGVMTETEARRRDQRRIFQENLIKEGLELEIEDRFQSFDEKTYFIKIHMPWRTEVRLAEVLNLKLPVKRFITISVKAWDDEKVIGKAVKLYMKWKKKFSKWISLDPSYIEEEPSFYNATAGGNPEEQFIVKDRASTYTSAQRSLIVMQILLRTKYDETEKCGIRRLLNDGTFMACFPLHEGRYDKPHSSGAIYDRRLLYLQWARPAKWYKKQPLNLIRKYFGDKIGLYFCWLGFYTQMLIYPAIVGTLCFIYGLATMESEDNTPSKEICDTMGAGNTTLCPMCDKGCSYTRLSESCPFARLTYLFDNPSTVFFAIFMSFWATTFLELWKRKQSVIIWEWDLQNVEADQEARPEFETSVKTFRINPVTREREPYMPTWTRAIKFAITGSAVFFMICVVLSAVLGTIIYRLSVYSLIYSGSHQWLRQEAKVFTIITAAIINLTVIMILTRIYHRLAIYLTNLENPRTQTEYEDSYTFKIFFFEFMNFYSSLIYIAFFKGRFYDYPGDDVSRENSFYRLKADICDPAGCLSELCIQLAIIMIGKQCWNNFMEYLFPKFWNWWRLRKHKAQTKDESHLHMTWEQDYHMQDPGRLALFDEYLEMILQYGFLTLFVAAFPLAPLFALLNNIAEIRLDAFKMVTQARRPLAERVEDIGAWFGILRIITYASVVTNAFVIAYTSDFIPRMVYKYVYSRDSTLSGYIQHSLSPFSTKYVIEKFGIWNETDPKLCYYRGYRNGEEENYSLQSHYWHVFAARLAFVVIFEHVVFTITGIMRFLIPDIPAEVKTQIQREQLLAKEAKYQHGLKKSQDGEYQDLLQMIREQNTSINSSRQGGVRGNWARRFSRISDGIDSQLDGHVVNRPKRSINSTVWEVT